MSDNGIGPLLIVDDEEANRDMLARRLRRAGYEVELACSGEEALARVEERPMELVLLDVMMPGMNGIELLKMLRGTYSASELPVIMVSALGESAKVVEALNHGANDYVTKPIDFPVVVARIQSQLSRKRTEEALRESEERYALAARGSNDGLWDWNLKTNKVYYSPRWCEMLGYASAEISDSPEEWFSRIHPEDQPGVREEFEQHRGKTPRAELVSEYRIRGKDGCYIWVLCRGVVLYSDGGASRMAGSLTDITESKTFDTLTGLPNRALFNERLARAMEDYNQDPSRSYAVLFVDLDRFKVINDSLGHLTGDELLIGVAGRLERAVRGEHGRRGIDTVARFGGDEFAVLLANLADPSIAEVVADRVQKQLGQPFEVDGREVYSSASIGVALASPEYEKPDEVLRDADTAMYRAKSRGRSRYELFDSVMRAHAVARLELEHDLRAALRNHEFVVHYQSKIDLETEEVVGFEALVRWVHPVRGIISPGDFISVAEDTGLIVPIGSWVLEEACRMMADWQKRHFAPPYPEISVNVSPKQFEHADFVHTVRRVLEETQLPPETLNLEITESVLVHDPEGTLQQLTRLKELGIGLKIDDFGTGYSSLGYLNKFPFDALKIDRSFVLHMTDDPRSSEVVNTIVSLARSLRMEVVAEGVETVQQLNELRQIGCLFGQGFLFSKPLSPEDVESYIPIAKAKGGARILLA